MERRLRFLLVDDDVYMRMLIRRYAEPYGVVVEAVDGIEACSIFKESCEPGGDRLDLILMDYHMPGLDGFETVAEIRKMEGLGRCGRVCIVMVTSMEDPNVIMRSVYDNLCCRYLLKPVLCSDFNAMIEELFHDGEGD